MKTKAKLILAMSVLTAGVVAAGATGTFAWFTTNRAAQLNYTNVIAQKNAGNLDVHMGAGTSESGFSAGTKAVTGPGHDIAYVEKSAATDSNAKISDVSSGDGLKFVKPIWQTVSGNNQVATTYKDGVWGVDYTTFWFKVTNTGTNPLNVYLNSATAIKGVENADAEQKAKNDAAAKVARVAINAASKGEGDAPVMPSTATETWILENKSAVNQQYVTPGLADGTQAALSTITGEKAFVLNDSPALQKIDSSSHPAPQLLVESLAKENSAYFVVSVWLEGTKDQNDNFDNAAGGSISVLLDLAGTEVFKA